MSAKEELPKVEQIVEIHPECKYVFLIEGQVPNSQLHHLSKVLDDWWASDKPALVVSGGKLVKVR